MGQLEALLGVRIDPAQLQSLNDDQMSKIRVMVSGGGVCEIAAFVF
jgi:hypothetical protein